MHRFLGAIQSVEILFILFFIVLVLSVFCIVHKIKLNNKKIIVIDDILIVHTDEIIDEHFTITEINE